MDQRVKNLIAAIGIILFGVLAYFFSYIITYILIAAVLALVGEPITTFLKKIHYKRFYIGNSVASLLTIVIIWLLIITFFGIMIPLVLSELNQLANINVGDIVTYLNDAFSQLRISFPKLMPDIPADVTLESYLNNQLRGMIHVDKVTSLFGSVATAIGNLFLMVFSVSFILFFFLKEQGLFRSWILVLSPEKHEEKVTMAMDKIAVLLKRYIIGILFQIMGVMILDILGFSIVGIGFSHAVVVGVFAGFINVIPYIGPWIAAVFALLVVVANHLTVSFTAVTLPLMVGVIIVVMVVQFIDNMIFQTLIYSNSIKAHPLEIFFVVMIAGSLAGIPGMILGIPAYTVLRVIAGEFLYEFKVVRRLAKKDEG